ncbi:MAG TPA: HDIG domain-containing protein [Solirubrobacteraceae bacterium]|nr:HDIG domain-containing protein [Solirubrobacteraceae bacterium]
MSPPEALAGLGDGVWLVGGALRDELLGLRCHDFDLAVAGDARALARELGRATGAASFALSDAFGAWRVIAADRSWQVDLTPLTGPTLEADLARRDLTVNAMARPVTGGAVIDPHGGRTDLAARRLRQVGEGAFSADPLRVLRLARQSTQLGFRIEPATLAAARAAAPGLIGVAGERVFAELRQILGGERPVEGLEAFMAVAAASVVLPELEALRGVEQSVYHHRDVLGHTLEAVAHTVALERDPKGVVGLDAAPVRAFLAEPCSDEMTRAEILRWGALLHDIAKPGTRAVSPEGRVSFYGHDREGALLARTILARLRASERTATQVAALTRHHLRLGFLVHRQPLERRDVFGYLAACEPVSADVTLLTVADRLATQGRNGPRATAEHLALAREIWPAALAWQRDRPRAPVRGDVLARALERAPGPWLAPVLEELAAADYAGELPAGPEGAIAHARTWLASAGAV